MTRCSYTDGMPGGCQSTATVQLVGVKPGSPETNLGHFCAYHSWPARGWFSRFYRVEDRPVTQPEAAKAA